MTGITPAANSPNWFNFDTANKGSLAENHNYLVGLRTESAGFGQGPVTIVANCPEQFGIRLTNEWESMISTFLGSSNAIAGGIQKGVGMAVLPQFLTAQVWRGTTPLEFNIPMSFNARDSALNDVVRPIRDLIRLASPYRMTNAQWAAASGVNSAVGLIVNAVANPTATALAVAATAATRNNYFENQILHSPGPTFWEYVDKQHQHNIQLIIGRAIFLESVVITSLDVEWDSRYTPEGYPISASANVGIKTHYTLDRNDLLQRIFPQAVP